MLKKSFRIGRKGLERFFKLKSGYFKGALLTARARRNNLAFNRFAFVVSGPKTRAAHLRNLAKRRMAEAARSVFGAAKPGRDVVFFMKLADRAVPPFAEIKEDIKNVLSKISF
ncbi:hypothetical protein A2926_04545 [Candidatus Giovannonibacteria bacterium RIFCSPLOWO2_01_FULL_44_40]|uniref:Uncharacterized protein n=1 Tax=Candidatus Giovannonibacteria bacterium RIFCSPHIGHO2_01_FULL_45_23 TaxID=1798325 RepID=A0A1F5VHU3_9BACT|nr:MAG: hypothetical protein A2834_02990 [Candidatus Giovannonibacteria bacterium RIFCSPHIGHO2_01_FULL_45_23]OGF75598.1 MAG: hypothetical protein A3C77_00850 [Candidatus Giovannonibacteria bacterium RIFCSPHIGHO2_02_FULL_45_13]OGF80105.1 MAG: hypothetical protein A2926_04545 [Candidatus Giovannonibacteria bacterium RIFCSPLOWO2_01_FULL_44_40]